MLVLGDLYQSLSANIRDSVILGTVVATDGSISGGMNPLIGAVAYTNSMAGTNSTELFDIDFNPTVDRIRLVSDTGQNLRLHPDLATVVAEDGDLNPGTPFVNGAAYTNSIPTATTTELFVLDSETGMLYKQDPPNDGVLVPVGSLGVDFTSENGFDIGGTSGLAYALLDVDGSPAVYQINLESGSATLVSEFNTMATAMALGLGF